MASSPRNIAIPPSAFAWRVRARQWSRAAWGLAVLFGSLPLASKLFIGVWGFEGAGGFACICLMLGVYLHIVSRRNFAVLRDGAVMLDHAIQLALEGRSGEGITLLTKAIRLNPNLWQAYQYRGELYLKQQHWNAALADFTAAIRLASNEPHLYSLRGQTYTLLNDHVRAAEDYDVAASLARQTVERGLAGSSLPRSEC